MSGSKDDQRFEIVDSPDVAAGVLLYPDGQCRILTNRDDSSIASALYRAAEQLDRESIRVEPKTECEPAGANPGGLFASSESTVLTVVLNYDGNCRVLTNRSNRWAAIHLRRVAESLCADTDSVRVCQVCGCTDDNACDTPAGPCAWWVTYDDNTGVCTACQDVEASGQGLL